MGSDCKRLGLYSNTHNTSTKCLLQLCNPTLICRNRQMDSLTKDFTSSLHYNIGVSISVYMVDEEGIGLTQLQVSTLPG